MNDLSPELRQLGDALEDSAAADLETGRPRSKRRLTPRRMLVFAVVLVVAIPGVAFAASNLVSTKSVAASLPAGTRFMVGTNPTCTVVKDGVEYHCVLAVAPVGEIAAGEFKGTVEPTVDATKHVNGGCRGLSADGREWECYIGQAAVDQKIVSQGFLGEYAPSPGVG